MQNTESPVTDSVPVHKYHNLLHGIRILLERFISQLEKVHDADFSPIISSLRVVIDKIGECEK